MVKGMGTSSTDQVFGYGLETSDIDSIRFGSSVRYRFRFRFQFRQDGVHVLACLRAGWCNSSILGTGRVVPCSLASTKLMVPSSHSLSSNPLLCGRFLLLFFVV